MTERVRGGKKWRTVRLPEEVAAAVESRFTQPFYPFYAKVQSLLDSYDLSHPKTPPEPREALPA